MITTLKKAKRYVLAAYKADHKLSGAYAGAVFLFDANDDRLQQDHIEVIGGVTVHTTKFFKGRNPVQNVTAENGDVVTVFLQDRSCLVEQYPQPFRQVLGVML